MLLAPLTLIPAFLLATAPGGENIPMMMLIVFGSAKLLGEVAHRLGMPPIVGGIIAGIVLGPSALGWVPRSDTLVFLADLGVLFLLFQVGLEVRSSELLKVGRVATVVAILGVVAPFAAGWLIFFFWGFPMIENFFAGTAMVATSIGITAQVLADKGLLDHVASRIILAAAVIDDVLGLIVLALVSSMAKGSVNFLEIGLTAGIAIGFTVIVAKWGSRAMVRLVPSMESRLVGEGQFTVAMVLLFALALLAQYAGVAAIIGAFLAGMALSESTSHRVHDFAAGISELLTPFFLVGIGLSLDLQVFRSADTLILSLLVLVVAVLSKLIGCGLGAWRLGHADAFRIGVGMVPRGEVGLVVAQIGASLGVIEQSVYGVVVFMALATTIVAPPLLNFAYKGVTPGTAVAEPRIG
ncbi:MAG: cation:proton antiporter [Bryobacteraceae bacterium]|nr:cation:proton antiporter [Bryobacteraceae bacterium]